MAAGSKLVEVGVPFDPIVFTTWSRQAQKFGQLDAGARLVRIGLKGAATLRFPPSDPRVLELQLAAAWLSLLQQNTGDLEEHLTVLRKYTGTHSGWTHLVDGLSSLEQGYLEYGVRELNLAGKYPDLGPSVGVQFGLAYANSALGNYDLALPHLKALERYYGKSEGLPEQYQTLASRLSMNQSGMLLEFFRCHLGLNHMELAQQYREQLRGKSEWIEAGIMLVRHRLGVGPTAVVRTTRAPRTPTPESLALARQELNDLRHVAPRDARLLLLETELLTSRRSGSLESAQARAEDFLRGALAGWQDDDEAQLIWACWLTNHGRPDEAGPVLDRLEKRPAGPLNRRIARLRNQWQLVKSRGLAEADKLLDLLGLDGDPSGMDTYLVASDPAIGRPEGSGLDHFWRGQAAQVRGELEAAARSYGTAMAFSSLRAAARRHLLACVLRLRDQGESAVGNTVVSELLQSAFSPDPVLLVAFIETALPLDNLTGPFGIQKAMDTLEGVLAGQVADRAALPVYRARTWLSAGRSDLAKVSVEQALKANPKSLPSLLLAGDVARANEDWPACLRYAEALEKVCSDRPETVVWRAEALAHVDAAAAERAYRALTDKYPDRPDGHRGLIGLRERAKDYPAALIQARLWQARLPGDAGAFQAEVRLLCRAGRTAEAGSVAETAVKSAPAARAPEIALAAARGFLGAAVLDPALVWGKKAEDAAVHASNRETLLQARCLLGETYRAFAARTDDADRRRGYLDQAIDQYRAAFKDVPGQPDAGRPLALLLALERGEAEAAFAIAQRLRQGNLAEGVRSGDQLSLDLLDTLGTVYRATKHDRETVALFREASKRYAGEPLVFFHLGRAYAALSQSAEATENLKRAAELADARSAREPDPEEKARWLDLAKAARLAEKELNRR